MRPKSKLPPPPSVGISIHAPLAGCDGVRHRQRFRFIDFNPRTPCGVRLQPHLWLLRLRNFNPRTPCGVRLSPFRIGSATSKFQSTHPLRGATERYPLELVGADISIHAPLAGCDRHRRTHARHPPYFNPRTPCGVRPFQDRMVCNRQ